MMTTKIVFEVPTEDLRKAEFLDHDYQRDAGPEDRLISHAQLAFVKAQEALPPQVPVSKDTKWGQKVAQLSRDSSRVLDHGIFVGLNPRDDATDVDFHVVYESDKGRFAYPQAFGDGWFEVHDAEPASEPGRVPAKMGQTRLMPVEVSGVIGHRVDVAIPMVSTDLAFSRAEVEGWGVVE